MASGEVGAVLKSVETLFNEGTAVGLTDVQLLDRYVGPSDQGAEAAFAVLVKRHGPMVLRLCRGELDGMHAAEDAFQATFLILARKARSIRKGESLASWLYGVARRVARRARLDGVRRVAYERRGALMVGNPSRMEREPSELVPEIQEEVDRLPGKYREPIILCYLEGLTHEEAASQLRIPVGTVKIRLSRGRERLRGRLVRRGLAPTLVASALSTSTRGAVPVPLLDMTVKAAMHVAAVRAAGGSVAVTSLVEGVLRAMFLSKLRTIAAFVATSITLIATSLLVVSAMSRPVRSDQEPDPSKTREVLQSLPKAAATQTPDRPEVEKTFTVKKSVFHRTTRQPVRVEAFQLVNVYPKVSGELSKLNVDIGDAVRKGQILATIDSPDLRYEFDKARARVRQAQVRIKMSESKIREAEAGLKTVHAQIAAAEAGVNEMEAAQAFREKQLKRIKDLVERHAVDERLALEEEDHLRAAQAATVSAKVKVTLERAELERARAIIDSARSEHMEAEEYLPLVRADSDKAESALNSCAILSPIDGVVTRRNYHVGEFARTAAMGGSEPLVTIVEANKLRVVVWILDQDAVLLNNGDPVTFRADARSNREYKGTISRTAVAEDPTTHSVRAEIDLDNSDGSVRPGQAGSVTVNLEDYPDVITIPQTAYFRPEPRSDALCCYRVVNGRAVRTPIKLEAVYNGVAKVVDGLKEGDSIILDWTVVKDPDRKDQVLQ